MNTIDATFLKDAGFKLMSPEQEQEILKMMTAVAERRVLYALTEHFSDQMAQDLEDESVMPDEAWLEERLPNYKQIISDELERMKVELRALNKTQR